ncbi:MAG: hypothetical protein AAB339_10770, partial [Elusimicrobiota bacterium]
MIVRFVLSAFLGVLPAAASAQTPPSGREFTLEEALQEAERSNPEIEAARKLWEARTHRIIQAATPEKP